MPDDSRIQLASWQLAFVDDYLKQTRSKSLLIAGPQAGVTSPALHTAKVLLERRLVDSVLVVTDRTMLRDQWRARARDYDIDLGSPIETLLYGRGSIALNIQALRSPERRAVLEEAAKSRRWFVIVDETGLEQASVDWLINRFLQLNEGSRALFIARTVPHARSFEALFRFDSQFIIERSVIETPQTESRLAQYSPSFQLLRQLQRDTTKIDDLSWRGFEKLIATLLEKEGYKVELMQGSKDGGVDVVAVKDLGAAGYFKALWQAKKKRKDKVGISVIRELADTRQEFGASKGIIVTSTYLTRGALERVERDSYLLGKVDRNDLEAWIRRTVFGPAGA